MTASNRDPEGGPPGVPVDPQGQPPASAPSDPPLPKARPIKQPASRPLQRAKPLQEPVTPRPATPLGTPPSAPPGSDPPRLEVEPEEEKRFRLDVFFLRNAPGWLVSTVFHTLLLIILALIVGQTAHDQGLTLQAVYAETLGEQLISDTLAAGVQQDDSVTEAIITPDDLPQIADPLAAPPDVGMVPGGTYATSKVNVPQVGLALQGREVGMKKTLLGAYGGNATTEAAVQLGLQWLAKNQQRDGSWSLTGPYTDGAVEHLQNREAATAMALLAFQGAGNTHQAGPFKKNVANGWAWLRKQQGEDGCFFHEGPYVHRFYTQGQCTIALCELLGMTKDPELREPAQKAVQYLLDTQSPEGGWRYRPKFESDVSVTGWIVMALQSARMAGLEVPQENLYEVGQFLDRIALEGGSRYPYREGEEVKVSMTAEALLCRQYLGWKRDDPRLIQGAEFITQPENLIDFGDRRDTYYWYYATQVTHHMEGEYWQRWNKVMRQVLPEQQVKQGREAGSWDPVNPSRDPWEAHGGRLFVTCLSVYMLEVYYRHLPLYSKVYTYLDSEKKP
jgi:hypothetical protein